MSNQLKEIPHVSELIKTAKHSTSYYSLLEQILKHNSEGEQSLKFYPTEEEDLKDWKVDEIRDKGYDISWSRACQWFEVSW